MTTRRTVLTAAGGALMLTATTGSGWASAPAWAAPPRPATFDLLQVALDEIVAGGAPAAVAELRQPGGAWRGSSGVARLGSPQPAPAHGRFRVGSVTKTFVATVALQLAAEGRLALDEPLAAWLPGTIAHRDMMTTRQLLQHTTGIPDYTDALFRHYPTNEDLLQIRRRTWTPHELLALAAEDPPLFQPGTSWSYSNTNYILLGLIIERITGRRCSTEVTRRILHPLRLIQTEVPSSEHIAGPHAHGYLPVERDGQTVPVDVTTFNPTVFGAAGDIVSTTADVNRFLRALLAGGLLPPDHLSQMLANPIARHSLGIIQFPLPCGTMLWGHTGTVPGYLTFAASTPDAQSQLTLSVTTGIADPGPAINNLILTAFCSPADRLATTWHGVEGGALLG